MAADKLLKVGTSAAPEVTTTNPVCDTLTVGSGSTQGIKIDTSAPTYPYQILAGGLGFRTGGGSAPTMAVFRDSIRLFSFPNHAEHELYSTVDVPRDYAPGTPISLYWTWAQNTVDTGGAGGSPGAVKWQAAFTYAKSYNQAAFPAEMVTSAVQTASGTQYQQLVASVVIATSSPGAGQIDSALLEPGGTFLFRIFRDPADAADTLDHPPFLVQVNIGYQSRVVGTKTDAPPYF
jgi:hypothetical protein